jgi:hypothetical protein
VAGSTPPPCLDGRWLTTPPVLRPRRWEVFFVNAKRECTSDGLDKDCTTCNNQWTQLTQSLKHNDYMITAIAGSWQPRGLKPVQ